MKTLKQLAKNAVAYVKDLYAREPERVNSAVLAALVAAAALFNVVIDPLTAAGVVALILGILLKGEVTRGQVYAPKTVEKVVAAAKRKKR